ncbi:sugar ABC transporter substrate-binding protein [Cutibacterium equinum]|uniref:Sugar ABC transporter substrate-binding protein n=1 Tax=Cutibacterium equinum TaxID=3016342 RepID=A0ABY7QVY7_9ACTN|nr:sugar ABC transporter substrate-binding protein [Cutibacterium equinum]WCC79225.1 sugar ABC transporter substrate-binding protein [Cutibacterium equinum]
MANLTIGRRQLLGGTAALATVLAASACGMSGSEDKPSDQTSVDTSAKLEGSIQFQTWSLKNEKFTPYFEKLIKDFEKEHPGTTIKWLDQPGEGYEEKIQQQATAGQLPDVINIPQTYAWQLLKANKVMDLKKADPKAIDIYTKGGIDAYTFDGHDGVYGYPWYLGSDLNWWNTEAFEKYGLDPKKLPTTRDELYEQAITMAEKSGGKMPLISVAPDLGVFVDEGIEVFKDGKFTFNTDEAVKIIDKYAELYAKKAIPPEVLQNNYFGNSKLFIQGKVAWTTGSASFPVDVKKDAPKLAPKIAMTKRIGVPPLFVQGLCVSADSKNPNLAVAFAQYVTNNTNQVEFVKLAQGFLPGTKEANDKPESFTSVIEDPQMKKAAELLADEIKDAKSGGPLEYTDAMGTYFGQQVASAIRGDITSKDALDKAVKYCNDHVAK